MDRKTSTLKEVAARAQVTKMAASVVLNGARSGTRVSEDTRRRILDAARELGYRPNTLARALVTRKTDQIAFYNGFGEYSLRNPFIMEVLEGIHQACEVHRKDLLIHGTFQDRSLEEIGDRLLGGSVDGVVAVAPAEDPLVRRLAAEKLPIVALADEVPGVPSVVVDDADGMRQITRHLHDRGHRNLVFHDAPVAHQTIETRWQTLADEAERTGMSVVRIRSRDWNEVFTPEEIRLIGLPRNERPTVVVGWNDETAFRLIQDCRRRGIRIPDDLCVTGFDGIESGVEAPFLTTIAAPWCEAAYRAVEHLSTVIAGGEPPALTVCPVQLVIGASA